MRHGKFDLFKITVIFFHGPREKDLLKNRIYDV